MMNNEQIPGMVPTEDGQHAVMIDQNNGHYGWVFRMHPDGMWVSVRKAMQAELDGAKAHDAFRKTFNVPTGAPAATSDEDERERVAFELACQRVAARNGRVYESHYLNRRADGTYLNPMAQVSWTYWLERARLGGTES